MRVRRFVVHERGTLRAAAALRGSARWETAVNDETFLRDLHAARDRAGRLRLEAGGQGPGEPALALALEELDVLLEELQVAEEEVQAQREALDDGQAWGHAERQRHQALFQLAPAPHLVTDSMGVILDANLRAAGLLGIGGQFVAGDDRPQPATTSGVLALPVGLAGGILAGRAGVAGPGRAGQGRADGARGPVGAGRLRAAAAPRPGPVEEDRRRGPRGHRQPPPP
jgi:hypothetical protein